MLLYDVIREGETFRGELLLVIKQEMGIDLAEGLKLIQRTDLVGLGNVYIDTVWPVPVLHKEIVV